MGLLLNTIIQQAQAESNKLTDGAWFDTLVNQLNTNVVKIADPTLKGVAIQSIDVLVNHRDDVMSMGAFTLTLFLQQLASGDIEQATLTYIQNQASPQDLIDGMNAGADSIILAKQQMDSFKNTAMTLLKNITVAGAQTLLPILISLI